MSTSVLREDPRKEDGGDSVKPRREFDLPEEDQDFLDARGILWESLAVRDGAGEALWVLLHDYPIPSGYSHETTSGLQAIERALVGIRVTGYPGGALDMAFFHPPLQREDGKAIASVTTLDVGGRRFQQWSRHYTNANPFRVGVDNISTHLGVMDEWLRRELRR